MLPEVRKRFLELLVVGNSPQVICRNLGLDEAEYFEARRCDAGFAEAVELAQDVKSQNIEAALYKQALEGNLSAMTQYLKLSPPPEWDDDRRGETNELMRMTLAELRDATESLRTLAGRIADGASVADQLHSAGSSDQPASLSESDSAA